MILFTPEMAEAILAGRKTVTRRRWKKPRVKVGAIHQCYTRPAFARPPGKPFARVRIVDVTYEDKPFGICTYRGDGKMPRSSVMTEVGAEGFDSAWPLDEFCRVYKQINGENALEEPCYRVEFELVQPGGE